MPAVARSRRARTSPLPTKSKMAKAQAVTVPLRFDSPESSSIDGATYEPETSRLTVVMRKGRVYDYDHVPSDAWARFLAASSKGEHFNAFIRPLYTGVPRERDAE